MLDLGATIITQSLIPVIDTIEYDRKYAAAVKELENSSIKEKVYFTNLHKIKKKLGFQVRPSPYNSFLVNVFQDGIFFSAIFILVRFIIKLFFATVWDWYAEVTENLLEPISIGVLIAIFMAVGFRRSFRSHSLTAWEKL